MIEKSNTMRSLWLAYLIMAITTLMIWTKNDWFPVTGDEPHYLIMTDGLINDRTFEQTNTYKREFKDKAIYRSGLAPAESTPSPSNTHSIAGPNGLYNVHNVGLPILLALPFLLAGTIGAKIFLVVLSSIIVMLSWKIVSLFSTSNIHRAVVVIAAAFSPTIFIASSQIYPDLVAGTIALYAGYRMLIHSNRTTTSSKSDLLLAIFIACLPWLQIKFAAVALILSTGMFLITYKKANPVSNAVKYFLPLLISLTLLATYNQYAFGKPTGPYGDDVLVFSLHSLMVFFGLHVDRFQGIFIQNPVYFIGIIFLVPFLKRNWIAGGTILLAYASFVVPNALHPNWYGGWSFAGRFAWSGAVTILPFVLYGACKITNSSKIGLYFIASLIVINFYTYSSLTFDRFELYNRGFAGLWISSYPSIHSALADFLPALFDSNSAYSYDVNGIFLVFFIGLIVFGFFYKDDNNLRFYRSLLLFVSSSLTFLVITGFTSTYHEEPMRWNAAELPSQIGVLEGGKRIATNIHGQGFLTYGPYIQLKSGVYEFEMKINAVTEAGTPVGYIEVFVPNLGEQIAKYEISDNGPSSIRGEFRIPRRASGKSVEIRTFYSGHGKISLDSLELSHSSR